ncbi:unnamed protein product [Dimorphilus gyrociliatus]|uniref:Uncharacterized protein n=1 Tax=Dimorphilus gyrociliatus TaxID=2664684 RepID=A0A7I8W766_9ANNE|nr:unnamed protein product [Dimorphilus gyrociliatus]
MKLMIVDAFTEKAFGGNPAAVCLVEREELSEELMQKIAQEMNLSETAFVFGNDFDGQDQFDLRWFTPKMEVDLCGHATLATTAALLHGIGNKNKKLTFKTRSGPLTAIYDGEYFHINLPLNPPVEEDPSKYQTLLEAALPPDLLKTIHSTHFSSKTGKLLVRLADNIDSERLRNLKVDTVKVEGSDQTGQVSGLIITLLSSGNPYDFISRYFAPWKGIPEDPVTGAAHTVLASYWSRELKTDRLKARQSSPRGGDLLLAIEPNGRLDVAGKAAIVLKGTIDV